MPQDTGGILNLKKPVGSDDIRLQTIGIDLPYNFQKIDDAFTAHLAESAQKHIAESGSNDDGYYIKFDDGTMIAYCTRVMISASELSAGSRVVKDIIPPQTFSSKISTHHGMYVNTSNDMIAINYIATLFNGANKVVVRHININTNTAAVSLNPVIIGRWK